MEAQRTRWKSSDQVSWPYFSIFTILNPCYGNGRKLKLSRYFFIINREFPACPEPETQEQKFNRLTYELNELAEAVSVCVDHNMRMSIISENP